MYCTAEACIKNAFTNENRTLINYPNRTNEKREYLRPYVAILLHGTQRTGTRGEGGVDEITRLTREEFGPTMREADTVRAVIKTAGPFCRKNFN